MSISAITAAVEQDKAAAPAQALGRVTSIDALRGLTMFTMIFVNDLAGVPESIVPPWMRHFHGQSGMTFVDLVFPAFLFIVGMSIPFALGSRITQGEPAAKIALHVLTRVLSLLLVGILMVNGSPDSAMMGWSGTLWSILMYASAIFAFCTIVPTPTASLPASRRRKLSALTLGLRLAGFLTLTCLALVFRGRDGHRIVWLSPFSIHTGWYGILGLIGWAYLIGALVFLTCRTNRTALLGCAVLLMCLYPADRTGAFSQFWLAKFVGIGGTLGSQAAITVAGILLASMLTDPARSVRHQTQSALLFIATCSAAALLLHGLYGINKNRATPSWCLWACAITATVWLILYFTTDVYRFRIISEPLARAGQNVFLAYLLSEMLPSLLELLRLENWYEALASPDLARAVARSAGCAVLILAVTAGLNRLGFRLKL